MKPKKLPYKKFLESFKYAPRLAVNLLVEREVYPAKQDPASQGETSLGGKEVLLTKRKKPPFAGHWHLPGSFVLKGEALMDCAKRVAKEELGIKVEIEKKNIELVGAFDDLDGDPRGHVVDLVYCCHIKLEQTLPKRPGLFKKARPLKAVEDTAEIKFFKKFPAKIGFNHKETLKKLGYV